jgi:hypothetical protein
VKKILRSFVMTALLLSMAQLGSAKDKAPAAAEETDGRKPVIVISIAGYDNVMGDIGYIGRLAQMPELEKLAEGIIASQTKAKGLEGLDAPGEWSSAPTVLVSNPWRFCRSPTSKSFSTPRRD